MVVLIGDIKHSRKLPPKERVLLQGRLERCLKKINQEDSGHILSPLMLTLGDEFQAVFKTVAGAWQAVSQLNVKVRAWQMELRYVLVQDVLLTPINKQSPFKMDGPAFWKARDLMTLKKQKYQVFIEGHSLNPTFKVLLRVMEDIENGWSRVTGEYVDYFLKHPTASIDQAAKHFKKNYSTLQRFYKSAKLNLYFEVQAEMLRLWEVEK